MPRGCDLILVRPVKKASELIPPEPPVAGPCWQNGAQGARARDFERGAADPCARAPFWHYLISTDGAGGMSGILRVGFERSSLAHASFTHPIAARRVEMIEHLLPTLHCLPFRHDLRQRQV